MPCPPINCYRFGCGPDPTAATFDMDTTGLPWKTTPTDYEARWSGTLSFSWTFSQTTPTPIIHVFIADALDGSGQKAALHLKRGFYYDPPSSTGNGNRCLFQVNAVIPGSGVPTGTGTYYQGSPAGFTVFDPAQSSYWYYQPVLWWYPTTSSAYISDYTNFEIPIIRTDS